MSRFNAVILTIFLATIAVRADELNPIQDQNRPSEFKMKVLNELIRKYASEKITRDVASEAKESADSTLKVVELFKGNWNYGNMLHLSHLILGRVHLLNGNVKAAIKELNRAAQTPGSPQLNTFGPSMTLAKELLEKGEKAAVLSYMNECLRFWTSESAKGDVAKWETEIARGKIPIFAR